jgi:hypothetical protein
VSSTTLEGHYPCALNITFSSAPITETMGKAALPAAL